jgi:hypothetical protein
LREIVVGVPQSKFVRDPSKQNTADVIAERQYRWPELLYALIWILRIHMTDVDCSVGDDGSTKQSDSKADLP